ncbi:hypothetical protein OS493_001184 [Desmophyllum pertusum]|uniref:Uncharacterized protein n=1 Tax=Desmophyllum pertusum TaxID=174260 RepID=A0A9X0D587_9CNID|nr:hypothetical protein OS493_001184 [Desmophyllum pertusum]
MSGVRARRESAKRDRRKFTLPARRTPLLPPLSTPATQATINTHSCPPKKSILPSVVSLNVCADLCNVTSSVVETGSLVWVSSELRVPFPSPSRNFARKPKQSFQMYISWGWNTAHRELSARARREVTSQVAHTSGVKTV